MRRCWQASVHGAVELLAGLRASCRGGAHRPGFIQTEKEVVLINDGDQQVRHVYLKPAQSEILPVRRIHRPL
jgi:hypothetical protein